MKLVMVCLSILFTANSFATETQGFYCEGSKINDTELIGIDYNASVRVYHPADAMYLYGKIKNRVSGKVFEIDQEYLKCTTRMRDGGVHEPEVLVTCKSTESFDITVQYSFFPLNPRVPSKMTLSSYDNRFYFEVDCQLLDWQRATEREQNSNL